MAALSVVMCSKSAKILFARQFVQMTRMELEEHIIQFSRNIDSYKDITHFESDKARFIFIPINTFFLILITSRNSNIIEDTEILKLIYRLIQDVCGVINADSIVHNAYTIMIGMDDIVGLGYRNSVNILQVKQYMQMESMEEKEYLRRKNEQEQKVKREMHEKSKEFDKLRREKKFMTDSISSSSFDPQYEQKQASLSKPYQPTYETNTSIEEEKKLAPLTQNTTETKPSKGMKLTKRKNYE